MATLNVYYNAGSDSGWSNESRAWDSSLSTAATISIAKSTNDTSHYLLNSTVTTSEPAGNYTITKVENGDNFIADGVVVGVEDRR